MLDIKQPAPPRATVYCEICGTELMRDYAYSYVVAAATTGHAYIGAFLCSVQGGQHWGCTPEHALEAAVTCAKEHMHPQLLARHEAQYARGQSKASDEDKDLEARLGPDFHIIRRPSDTPQATDSSTNADRHP